MTLKKTWRFFKVKLNNVNKESDFNGEYLTTAFKDEVKTETKSDFILFNVLNKESGVLTSESTKTEKYAIPITTTTLKAITESDIKTLISDIQKNVNIENWFIGFEKINGKITFYLNAISKNFNDAENISRLNKVFVVFDDVNKKIINTKNF